MARIAVDASSLAHPNPTGVEYYAREVLKRLPEQKILKDHEICYWLPKGVKVDLPQGVKIEFLSWPFKRGFIGVRLLMELIKNPPDIFFTPSHGLSKIHRSKTKICATIHDIAFTNHPELYEPKERKHQQNSLNKTLSVADGVLVVSKATEKAVKSFFGKRDLQIFVTGLAVNRTRFFLRSEKEITEARNRYGLNNPYILHTGRTEKKKGIDTLLRSFALMAEKNAGQAPCELVLVGSKGDLSGFVKQFIADKPHLPIHSLGYLGEDEMPLILQGAEMLAFPSRAEGFGLPNLEALAVGTGLVTSDIAVHREVVQDAGVFVPPNDVKAWSEALQQVLGRSPKEKEEWREKGFKLIENFSWDKTAQQTAEALVKILNV